MTEQDSPEVTYQWQQARERMDELLAAMDDRDEPRAFRRLLRLLLVLAAIRALREGREPGESR